MNKRFFLTFVISISSILFIGCGAKKTLHCDYCGTEIIVNANDKMEDDWVIYCETCNKDLFTGHPLLDPN